MIRGNSRILAYLQMFFLVLTADVYRYSCFKLHSNRNLKSVFFKSLNIGKYILRCPLCNYLTVVQYIYSIRHKCLRYLVSHHDNGYILLSVQFLHKLQHISCPLRVKHGCSLVKTYTLRHHSHG